MQVNPRDIRNHAKVMATFRERLKRFTQTEIAIKSGTTVQAVCDVVKRRRPPNAALLHWLGFELAYVGRKPRTPRRAPTAAVTEPCETDSNGASAPQPPAQDSPSSTAAPPGAEV